MSERQIEKVSATDPFTHLDTKATVEVLVLAVETYNLRPILGVELNKETGETVIVETGVEDIDQTIQQFKDDCGFEGMRKLLAAGQARPLDFADDGKHGADIVGLPDNVNDAYRASMASGKESSELFAKFGITPVYNPDGSIDMDATEKALTNAIAKILTDKAKEAAGVKEDETK